MPKSSSCASFLILCSTSCPCQAMPEHVRVLLLCLRRFFFCFVFRVCTRFHSSPSLFAFVCFFSLRLLLSLRIFVLASAVSFERLFLILAVVSCFVILLCLQTENSHRGIGVISCLNMRVRKVVYVLLWNRHVFPLDL